MKLLKQSDFSNISGGLMTLVMADGTSFIISPDDVMVLRFTSYGDDNYKLIENIAACIDIK